MPNRSHLGRSRLCTRETCGWQIAKEMSRQEWTISERCRQMRLLPARTRGKATMPRSIHLWCARKESKEACPESCSKFSPFCHPNRWPKATPLDPNEASLPRPRAHQKPSMAPIRRPYKCKCNDQKLLQRW